MTREKFHSEQREGFDVVFYACEEDIDPRGNASAIDEETDAQILADIESGTLLWFQVECIASKNGIELGHYYLGGCCYASLADFITPGEWYSEDMAQIAVAEAKQVLAGLMLP